MKFLLVLAMAAPMKSSYSMRMVTGPRKPCTVRDRRRSTSVRARRLAGEDGILNYGRVSTNRVLERFMMRNLLGVGFREKSVSSACGARESVVSGRGGLLALCRKCRRLMGIVVARVLQSDTLSAAVP